MTPGGGRPARGTSAARAGRAPAPGGPPAAGAHRG
ncbi:hypothetical protein KPATCC21470_5898 [Kitasatospora purpeofusca]